MTIRIDKFIEGIPYPQSKVRGDIHAPGRWSEAVKSATQYLPKVSGRVSMNLKFILHEDMFPPDHPHGTDLDNLLKRFLDAIGTTVLSKAEGKDGAVVRLTVSKRKVRRGESTGVRMIVNEL